MLTESGTCGLTINNHKIITEQLFLYHTTVYQILPNELGMRKKPYSWTKDNVVEVCCDLLWQIENNQDSIKNIIAASESWISEHSQKQNSRLSLSMYTEKFLKGCRKITHRRQAIVKPGCCIMTMHTALSVNEFLANKNIPVVSQSSLIRLIWVPATIFYSQGWIKHLRTPFCDNKWH